VLQASSLVPQLTVKSTKDSARDQPSEAKSGRPILAWPPQASSKMSFDSQDLSSSTTTIMTQSQLSSPVRLTKSSSRTSKDVFCSFDSPNGGVEES
jgi:hypothetical protein